jgi:hypothetical protein
MAYSQDSENSGDLVENIETDSCKWSIVKDVKGSGHELFEDTVPGFAWRD